MDIGESYHSLGHDDDDDKYANNNNNNTDRETHEEQHQQQQYYQIDNENDHDDKDGDDDDDDDDDYDLKYSEKKNNYHNVSGTDIPVDSEINLNGHALSEEQNNHVRKNNSSSNSLLIGGEQMTEFLDQKQHVPWIRMVLFSLFPMGFIMTFAFTHVVQLPIQVSGFVEDQTKTRALLALFSISSAFSIILGSSLAGYLSDHLKTFYGRRKPYILIGSLLTVVCFVLRFNLFNGNAFKLVVNLVLLCVQDTAQSMAMVSYMALIPDLFPAHQFGRICALYSTMNILGIAFGSTLFGNVLFAWPSSVIVTMICTAIVIATIVLLMTQSEPDEHYTAYSRSIEFSFTMGDRAFTDIVPYYNKDSHPNRIIALLKNIPIVAFECLKPLANKSFTMTMISWACISLAIHLFRHMSFYYIQTKLMSGHRMASTPHEGFTSFWSLTHLTGFLFAIATGFSLDFLKARKLHVIIPAFAFGIVTLMLCLITNYMFLWFTGFVIGPVIASVYATHLTMANEMINGGCHYGTSLALFYMVQKLTNVLADPLGALIVFPAPNAGFYILFVLCALLSVASAIVIILTKIPKQYSFVSGSFSTSRGDGFSLYGDDEYGVSSKSTNQDQSQSYQSVDY